MTQENTHHDVSANTIFGFWIYLMTDFILFATLFATYAVLRNNVPQDLFTLSFSLYETLVLLTSCFSCGMAMVAAARQDKNRTITWFVVTLFLGLSFLAMVGEELASQIAAGNTWQKSAFLSSYFTLVGTHWLHVFFAVLFIIVFTLQVFRRGFTEAVTRRLTCLSLFWFFSYLVWIFMFTFVYLIGVL